MIRLSTLRFIVQQTISCRADDSHSRLEVLLTLVRLHVKSKFGSKTAESIVRIAGYTIKTNNLSILITLYVDIFLKKIYEFTNPGKNPFIIDAGAHIGMATIFFKMRCPDSTILAFEPNPDLYALLLENIATNKLTKVQAYNVALANSVEQVNFFIPERSGTLNSSFHAPTDISKQVTVSSERLSKYLPSDRRAFVKIDIEGGERELIEDLGQSRVLSLVDEVIVEYHTKSRTNVNGLTSFLELFKNDFVYSNSMEEDGVTNKDLILHLKRREG